MFSNRACRAHRADLPDLVDGRIDGARLSRLEAHLASCPLCSAVVAAHRRVKRLLGAAERPELRRSVSDEVVARLRSQTADHRFAPVLYWSGAGAVIASVVLAVGLMLRPSPTPVVTHRPSRPALTTPETMAALSDPTGADLCAREHARVAAAYAKADRAAWSLTLAEGNRGVVRP